MANVSGKRGQFAKPTLGVGAMQAKQLLEDSSTSFGPETLKAIGQAPDEAWADIAGNFGSESRQIEMARLKLASAILAGAAHHLHDVEALKQAGIMAMALRYR
jgi:hypothetical protein